MRNNMTYEEIFASPKEKTIKTMESIAEKCKNDPDYKQELINHPNETLKAEGLEFQKNISFQIITTKKEADLLPDNVIPLLFEDNNSSLSPEELDKVAGGFIDFSGWRRRTPEDGPSILERIGKAFGGK